MGIPRFYAEYIRNKTSAIKQRYEGKIASLSIDLNGIIHNATQQVFAYGGFDNINLRRENMMGSGNSGSHSNGASTTPKDLNIMYNDVGHKVTGEIMRLYNRYKPDMLVIAVDGVAPLAKIDQQRSRRYIGSIEALAVNDPTLRFDSAAISPGTEFMITLDNYIKSWLNSERNNLCYRVVYSSHLIPGEGEHKIMDMMRNQFYDTAPENIHLLHGADADLFMLSMISPLKGIWIVREDNYGTTFIDIETLKSNVTQQLGTSTSIQDFVIIGFLLGNDFLPHIFGLSEVIETLDTAIAIYKQNAKPLTVDNKLNMDGLKALVQTLAFSEKSYLERAANKIIKYPHPALEAAKTINQSGSASTVTLDYDTFRSNWYAYNISPKLDSRISNYQQNDNDVLSIIDDAGQAFVATLEWVWLYYSQGIKEINLDWYYCYSFAPLMSDLANDAFFDGNFREHLVESDTAHAFFHPLQQMLMIMHPRSSNLIPYGLGSLMASSSSLADLYPVKAIISHDGYDTDWQKDILLPALDPQRIVEVVRPITIPNIHAKYPHETNIYDNTVDRLKKQNVPQRTFTRPITNTRPTITNTNTRTTGVASSLGGGKGTPMIRPLIIRR